MKILLTNDDGYTSEGLTVLSDALVAAGHEVWVCAPSVERSASSHAMTLHQEVTITEFGTMRYHCSGTPVDCILYATRAKVFDHHPDLVISGINHGFNISTDILTPHRRGAREARSLAKHAGLSHTKAELPLPVLRLRRRASIRSLRWPRPTVSSTSTSLGRATGSGGAASPPIWITTIASSDAKWAALTNALRSWLCVVVLPRVSGATPHRATSNCCRPATPA